MKKQLPRLSKFSWWTFICKCPSILMYPKQKCPKSFLNTHSAPFYTHDMYTRYSTETYIFILCKVWQSTWGKWWLTHWASLLRWIWSISEISQNWPSKNAKRFSPSQVWPQIMCHTHSWPLYKVIEDTNIPGYCDLSEIIQLYEHAPKIHLNKMNIYVLYLLWWFCLVVIHYTNFPYIYKCTQ